MNASSGITKKKKTFSAIWFLPIIASVIGIWLLTTSILNAPIKVTVITTGGDQIKAGETEVKIHGHTIGKVSKVAINTEDPSFKTFALELALDANSEKYLKANTDFWIVKPQVSMAGISGLDTILSGNYIAVRVHEAPAPPTRHFIALQEPPPRKTDDPGLHFTLTSENLGSINIGSPILYKKYIVGEITNYKLSENGEQIIISAFIKPDYQHLIKSTTKFWNASGIEISGSLPTVNIRTESLTSILIGGISFQTPKDKKGKTVNNDVNFHLYKNYATARTGIPIIIESKNPQGLLAEQKIIYRGFEIGIIDTVKLKKNPLDGAIVSVLMKPESEPLLKADTKFWVVRPNLSLSEISGLDTFISGNYIEMQSGNPDAEAKRFFTALEQEPPLDQSTPGLHLTLNTQNAGSLSKGLEIFYRKIVVGSVQQVKLAEDGNSVNVKIFIKPDYAHLVNSNTRFWHASGLHINGGLGGINIETESLTSILRGGIAFNTPSGLSKKSLAANGDDFTLFDNRLEAEDLGIPLTFSFKKGYGLKPGTEIKYHDIKVGEVKSVYLNKKMTGVIVKASLIPSAKNLARRDSRFWVVEPKLGLAETSNLDTLISGQYISVIPGKSSRYRSYFTGLEKPPKTKEIKSGLNLTLTSPTLGGIKQGVKIFYREIAVGKVTGYALANNSNHVEIYINIEEKYAPLVREHSVFWNTSGIGIDFGLFTGAEIRTNSLESILAGGIAFATPSNEKMGATATPDHSFILHTEMDKTWASWAPTIELKKANR